MDSRHDEPSILEFDLPSFIDLIKKDLFYDEAEIRESSSRNLLCVDCREPAEYFVKKRMLGRVFTIFMDGPCLEHYRNFLHFHGDKYLAISKN
jgi:hypothetical protein